MPCNYKEYPKNWKTEIVPAVLKRAGEIREGKTILAEAHCENCGVENHSLVNRGNVKKLITRIVLTVAHLDHDKGNHEISIDRLAAWCQKCHLGYDRERHMEKARLTFEKRKQLRRLFD